MMITELASHMVCQPTGCGKLLVLLLDKKVPCIVAGEDGNSQWEYYSRNAQSKLSFVTAIAICCDAQQLSLPLCHHNIIKFVKFFCHFEWLEQWRFGVCCPQYIKEHRVC